MACATAVEAGDGLEEDMTVVARVISRYSSDHMQLYAGATRTCAVRRTLAAMAQPEEHEHTYRSRNGSTATAVVIYSW